MNKRSYLYVLLIILMFALGIASGYGQTIDSTFFWDGTYDEIHQVHYHKKVDDGVLLSVSVNNTGPGIMKLDKDGSVVWSTLNTFPYDYIGTFIPRFDVFSDGYLYAVAYKSNDQNSAKYFIKVDTSNGLVVWVNRFYPRNNDIVEFAEYDSTSFVAAYLVDDHINLALLSKSEGDTLKTSRFGSPTQKLLGSIGVVVDKSKNIYFYYDDTLAKLNLDHFDQVLWSRSYLDGSTKMELFHRIFIDRYDNIFLLGKNNRSSGGDGIMIRVDPQSGFSMWRSEVISGEISVADVKEYKDSLYAIYRHSYVGGIVSRYFTVKVNKETGERIWLSNFNVDPVGSEQSHSGNSNAGLSIDLDCFGDAYVTGYYGDANYGPEQWGTIKLDAETGDKLFDLTITNFPGTFDNLSTGLIALVFDDTARLIGKLEVANNNTETVFAKINPDDGALINKSGIESGIQSPSTTLNITSLNDTVYVLKQRGEEVILEAHDQDSLVWELMFDEEFYVQGGRFTINGGFIYFSTVTLNPDASPPQPDKLFIHKIDKSNGKIENSGFLSLGKWGIKPLEVVASNDSVFVFYKDNTKVKFFNWNGWVVNGPYELQNAGNNTLYEGDINLTVDIGRSICYIGDDEIFEINKSDLSVTTRYSFPSRIEPYQVINVNDTFYLCGRSSFKSSLMAFDKKLSTLLWEESYAAGCIYRITASDSGLYAIGVDTNVATIREVSILDGGVNWEYILPVQGFQSKHEVYSVTTFANNSILGIGGSVVNMDASSDAILLVLSKNGDSLALLIEQDGIGKRSLTRTVAAVSDSSFWIGGSLNRLPGYYQGFIYKIKFDSIPFKLSIDEVIYNSGIFVYPNPANDVLRIGNIKGKYTYTVFDLKGRTIMSAKGNSKDEINIETLRSGIYYILVNDGRINRVDKFIKL